MPISLRFDELRRAYRGGSLTPVDVAAHVLETLRARGDDHVWTALADPASIMQRARELAARADSMDRLPLYGLPFGVKDNVDVAGMPTACGCPGFARIAASNATAVQKALDAGALFIGKQSLDQFATGLNGTRALGGFCRNTFNPDIIPGGSSTGSGVSVAAGLVSFALGSDTGGSGRIPAALNNIVGLRPSVGLVGSRGMVYNNRLFDCMPIFASTVAEASSVLRVIAGSDDDDPIARISGGPAWSLEATFPSTFVFAVPDALEFFGDHRSAQSFDDAVRRLESLGGTRTTIPFAPFREAGSMVFESALVAERAASYGRVLEDNPDELVPAVASILRRAREYSAVEAFQTLYRLSELRGEVRSALHGIDVLVTPTVPRAFTVGEMLAEPIERNNQVGHYTYGVGPLDLCALAVPAAIRSDGIPFGISLVGRAGEDGRLIALGERFQASVGIPPGIEALA
jgi:allophanate hydrolase